MDNSEASLTPEDIELARRLAKRLIGTSDDHEMVLEEEFEVQMTRAGYAYFDTLAWKCRDCEHWCQTNELKDEVCIGCR